MSSKTGVTANEGWSTDIFGEWSVSSSITAASNADNTNTVHTALGSSTTQVGLYADGDISFGFTTVDTDINTSNDMILPGSTLTFIRVPRGIGKTVVLNILSADTNARTVKVVQV